MHAVSMVLLEDPSPFLSLGVRKKKNHIWSAVGKETEHECTHSAGALTINRGSSLTLVHQEWKAFESPSQRGEVDGFEMEKGNLPPTTA